MTFEEIVDQAIALLQRRGRVAYRTLKRQFQLDEEALNDLKDELLYAHPQVRDDEGRGLVWTGDALVTPTLPSPPEGLQEREPLSYTPPHLAEKILTSRSTLEGERKQVTVLFADLKGSAVYFYFRGAYDQAIAAAQRALALATAGGDVVLGALANLYLGFVHYAQGDYRRAIEYYGQTVASLGEARHFERFGIPVPPAVYSRAFGASCHAELGMFVEGRALGEEGLQIAEAVAQSASLMFASWGMGRLALRQGDLPRAVPLLERAVVICQDADFPLWLPRIAEALGAAYTLGGRVADAVPLLTRATERAIAMEAVNAQALCRFSLGEAQLLDGRLEEAHALAERALALAREHQERGHQAYALRLLGEIAARREPPDIEQAEAYYRQALTLAEALGMRPLQAHCHRGLGTLYAKMDQGEQVRAELSTAIDLYRAMQMTFWLPQAEAALAEVEGH